MDKQKPALVIMAAGMGSRFGGLKQIEPVDPEGHIIIDFSLFDSWRAGFRDVVFIIKREMEAEFRACIGDRMERYFHVSYVYQDLDRLPEGIEIPKGRTKPWGTGHALAKKISPVFEADLYDAISLKACVERRLTIGAPGEDAMKEVIRINREFLNHIWYEEQ